MFESLEIFLGGKCNFNCSFCELKKISLDKLSDRDIEVRLKKIFNYSKFIKKFEILGGEPLLHEYLPEIININNNLDILINTNLYKPFEYKSQNIVKINATFHPDFISLEKFTNNLKLSSYNKLDIVIMYNKYALEYYDYFKENFKNNNVYIESILNLNNKKYDFNLTNFSKIQNMQNTYINKSQYEILNDLPTSKICKRSQLTYNFNKDKMYKCLTKLFYDDGDMGDNCKLDVCFCDSCDIRKIDEN